MASIDLHKLANTPGFGRAAAEIRKSGHWDEFAGTGDELREFTVIVTGIMSVSKAITVEARSVDEAEKIAINRAASTSFDWDCDGDADDISAEALE